MMRVFCGRQVALLLCGAALVGCSQSSSIERFPLSGEVRHADSPVPAGSMLFSPDHDAGNSGPSSVAEIVDGSYSLEASQAVVGGPYIVQIRGYDGSGVQIPGEQTKTLGNPLFPEKRIAIDLPFEAAVRDFDLDE